jgi:hypothetical protein
MRSSFITFWFTPFPHLPCYALKSQQIPASYPSHKAVALENAAARTNEADYLSTIATYAAITTKYVSSFFYYFILYAIFN